MNADESATSRCYAVSSFRRAVARRLLACFAPATFVAVISGSAHAQEQSPAVVAFEGQIQQLKDAEYVWGQDLTGSDPTILGQNVSGHIQGVAAIDGGRRFVLPTTFTLNSMLQMLAVWNEPRQSMSLHTFVLTRDGWTGGAQAAGNIVVVGVGGSPEVRFFYVDESSNVTELSHLKLGFGTEFPALAYHPTQRRYYVYAGAKIWVSDEGWDLTNGSCPPRVPTEPQGCWKDITNRWPHDAKQVNPWEKCGGEKEGQGMAALLYDSAVDAMYYACGRTTSGNEVIAWQNLRIENSSATPTYYKDEPPDPNYSGKISLSDTVWNAATEGPSFRWGGGLFTDSNGALILVLSMRNLRNWANPLGLASFSWQPALWRSDPAVWVDFGYNGTEQGTSEQPFNTLAEGVAAVPRHGILKIKTGSSPVSTTINKPMKIIGVGGAVRLGP